MFKIKNILNTDRRFYSYLLLSIPLIVFGVSLIIDSLISISLLQDNSSNKKFTFNNQIITKVAPRFNIREDLSIKDLSNDFVLGKNNNKNNQSADQSLINFNLDTVKLNSEISIIELQTLSNEFYSTTDVNTKKESFIISILPLVVQENEKIRANRERLLEVKNFLIAHKTLDKQNQLFLKHLASEYHIKTLNKHKIDIINKLLILVDEIPHSIVIAQAANESGWGTSRFAKEFNALFGEYTFDINNGVIPTYRDEGEKYLVKFFSNINESIESYFKNLNSHPAYKDFREARKKLRNNNLKLDPIILIRYLKPYAKDKNYVKNIESIIKTNKLIKFDSLKTITTKS